MKTRRYHKWDIIRNNRHSTCSAWPRWYAGFSCGRFGIGIVRETWGWRVMLGPWDACKMEMDNMP